MYNIIKKQNGEKFAQKIQAFDSRIFNIENFPQIVKYAGRDAEPILGFLQAMVPVEEKAEIVDVKNPIDLLKEAGYDAFVVNTLEEKNSIEKYYYVNPLKRLDERICTLKDPARHLNYHMIHAVKEGADKLNRLDFLHPERQDEYGTSVISIQMRKSGGHVSIKNRYNHTVPDCDNTFSSNPDNIIKGLSDSLQQYFHVDFHAPQHNIPDGYTFQNGILYKYNVEFNNIYFSNNSYLKQGIVHEVNRDYQLLVGSYLIDLREKRIENLVKSDDIYASLLTKEMEGKKIQKTLKNGKTQILLDKQLFMEIDEKGVVRKVRLEKVEELPDSPFLHILSEVEEFDAPNLKKLGSYLLSSDRLTVVNMPQLEEIGDHCLYYCPLLENLNLPQLKKIGSHSVGYLNKLTELCFPNLKEIGNETLSFCDGLKSISLPQVEVIGNNTLTYNASVEKLLLPQLKTMGSMSLLWLSSLKSLYLPNLKEMDYFSIAKNSNLKKVVLPKLEKTGVICLYKNARQCVVEAPMLKTVGYGTLNDAVYKGAKFEVLNPSNEDVRKIHVFNEIQAIKKNKSVFSSFSHWVRELFVHTR